MIRRPGRLGANIAVGGLARVWRLLLQFGFTPIYIALLGPENYGLVTVNATLVMLVAFLDGAVSPVVVREMGRMAGQPEAVPQMHRLLRSLEYVSVGTALGLGLVLALAAPWVARHWLQAGSLSPESVTLAFRLMALNLALLWPSLLYSAVLIALHRQAAAFWAMAPLMLVQSAGAALLLHWQGADIHLFLGWMIGFAALSSLIMGRIAWRALPPAPGAARFDQPQLLGIWRFAAGSFIICITTSLLTQADKVVMARFLPLDAFAGYALAFFVAQNAMALALAPIGVALQPHFAALVAAQDEPRLVSEYHRWSEVLALAGFTLLGTLAAFPTPPLHLWLGSASPVVPPVAALLPWVLVGTLLNALISLPFAVMMATGWVRMVVWHNGVAAVLFCLALWLLVPLYGALVGPLLWAALNVSYFVLLLPRMHRRHLRGQGLRWFWRSIARPGGITLAVLGLSAALLPATASRWWGLVEAGATAGLLGGALLLALPQARETAFRLLRRAPAVGR